MMGRPPKRMALAAGTLGALALSLLFVASAPATADVSIVAPPLTYTGASFWAQANATDPASVVLYEWDFTGDGSPDVNRTDGAEAWFVYLVPKPDYEVRLTVTRLLNGSLASEQASRLVSVLNGTPSVSLDAPDRLVADSLLTFSARASDPDASTGGEPFAYRWTLDGALLAASGPQARFVVPSAGSHEVAVEVTDAEGLTNRSALRADFAAPSLFEGRAGTVLLGLVVAGGALALGVPLVRLRTRERKAAEQAKKAKLVEAVEDPSLARARPPPRKVPLAASSSGEVPGGPRILVGGTPSAILTTRECGECHSAIDASLPECPYCSARRKAEALEARLASDPYEGLDLSQARALLQRARRERHLLRIEAHEALLAEAEACAQAANEDRTRAKEALSRAREALERALAEDPMGGERTQRASAYLKLAESLALAKQFGKAARHAQRAREILAAERAEPEADACHACGGAITASRLEKAQACPHCGAQILGGAAADAPPPQAGEIEAAVRAELSAVRKEVSARQADLDAEAFKLVELAATYERVAEWQSALEVVRALKEKLERARIEPPEGPQDPPPGAGQ